MRIVICLLMLILSCKNNKSVNQEQVKASENQELVISKTAIENLKYADYGLSQEAKDIIQNWTTYKSLQDQINYLREADVSFYKSDKKELEIFIEELKTTIPEDLNEKAITARLVVLETKILKLNDNLLLNNIDISVQLLSIKEVLVAFSSLNLRIDKLLEFKTYNSIQPE